MKNLKHKNKALALLLAVLMTLSIFTVLGTSTAFAADSQTLYLKPNSNWLSGNARFAAYVSGGSSSATWVSMTNAGDGYYKADITGNFTKVTFVRMNPNTTENTWANQYNKAAAQTIPTNGNNCFTIDAGQWSNATGSWSTYKPAVATTLYLKPNSNWTSGGARFAAYLSGGTGAETWVSMTSAGNGYYKADVVGNFTKVTFVRMNPDKLENTWANQYNKSASQTIPTNGNNCFTITDGQWSNATGTWSTYKVATSTTLYLKPNSNWVKDNARFAAYLSGGSSSETWVSMTNAGNGYYKADVTGSFTKVTFVRMNPNKPENTWANQYNKSAAQTLPTNGNNCFTINEGQWSNATGTWSTYKAATSTALYLKPNSNWVKDNARFAAYLSGGTGTTETWVSMTNAGNGYYKADVTGNFTKVTFVRMNPNKPENTWANQYNKSAAQTIPTNGNNCFTINEGQWSNATGTWSKYATTSDSALYLKPNSNWLSGGARFAAYLSGGTSTATWVSMTNAGNGYYKADVTGNFTKVTFVRMNPNKPENTWENQYNKSAAQTLPTNGNNCFTINDGQWSNATGTWSKYSSATEPTAVIHFMDDNDREPVVAKVGDTVEYNVYLKLTAPEVQAFAAWTYYNQPVGTKKTNNQQGIIDTTKIPASCDVLSVKKENYTAHYSPYDTGFDLHMQKNLIIGFGMGSMNNDLSYNMLKTNNGTFTQSGGCLVSTIKFTVINPGEVEVFTRMDEAIVDLDNGEVHAEYVAVYNEKVEDGNVIYFDPNSNWDKDARFAMYLSGGSSAATWVSMTSAGNGLYKAELPEGNFTKVTFVRMNPNKLQNVWENQYNKSASQTIPTDGKNCFTMTEGQWSNATGTWK